MRKLGLMPRLALTSVLVLVRSSVLALVLGAPAPADAGTPPNPAERARALEEVGKFAEAARLYEAAVKDGKAPGLLYRLALCKRHLGDYAGAREALRGYLREEPGGPLRIEVERQLAQLQVLIEERGLHPERAPHGGGGKKAGAGAPVPGAVAVPVAGAVAEPGSVPVSVTESVSVNAAGSVPVTELVPVTGSVPESVSGSAPVPASGAGAGATHRFAPASSSAVTASDPAVVAAAAGNPAALPAAPVGALAPVPASSSLRPALPLAAGAAAAGLAGALLLWDGARVSSELDARFATGDLTAADQPRYTRAHREGAFGVALVSLAVLAAGAAVWSVAF